MAGRLRSTGTLAGGLFILSGALAVFLAWGYPAGDLRRKDAYRPGRKLLRHGAAAGEQRREACGGDSDGAPQAMGRTVGGV